MADNVTIKDGSGTSVTVRTDQLATNEQIQAMKVILGAAHAEDLLLDSGQQTMNNSLPVVVASNQTAVSVKPQAPDGNASEFSCATVGAHGSIDSATLVAKQTTNKPDGATGILAQNTGTANLRFTLDGTDPTAAVGFVLPASWMPMLIPCPGTAIEWIREAAGAALDYQWMK